MALSERPGGGYVKDYQDVGINCPNDALTLPSFYNSLRLLQTQAGSLPLITYERGEDDSRTRANDHPAYYLLKVRPNPAMSRAVMMQRIIKDMYLEGNAFLQLQWSEGGELLAMYPLDPCKLVNIVVDDQWNKTYVFQNDVVYFDYEIAHFFLYSHDGFTGVPFLSFACENLSLHKQVQTSATALYRNAPRPSLTVNFPNGVVPSGESKAELLKWLESLTNQNTGKPGVLTHGGILNKFPHDTVEESRIIEALQQSTSQIGSWMQLSSLMLGDYSRGTYSNLGADNVAFYQRTLRSLLDMIEQELNHKVFGDSEYFAEFLVESILRGSPEVQAAIDMQQVGIVKTHNELRRQYNLDAAEGGDSLWRPSGVTLLEAPAPEAESPQAAIADTGLQVDAALPVQAQAMNGAQIASLLSITTNVVQGLLTKNAAIAIIEAGFPTLDAALIGKIINELEINGTNPSESQATTDEGQPALDVVSGSV